LRTAENSEEHITKKAEGNWKRRRAMRKERDSLTIYGKINGMTTSSVRQVSIVRGKRGSGKLTQRKITSGLEQKKINDGRTQGI